MTLLTTSGLIASSSGLGTTRKLKDDTPSLAERGKTVTPTNESVKQYIPNTLPAKDLPSPDRVQRRVLRRNSGVQPRGADSGQHAGEVIEAAPS
jgi:hypothetical protein